MSIEDLATKEQLSAFIEERFRAIQTDITHVDGLGDKLAEQQEYPFAEIFRCTETFTAAEAVYTAVPGCKWTAPKDMQVIVTGIFDVQTNALGALYVNGVAESAGMIHVNAGETRDTLPQVWLIDAKEGDVLELRVRGFGTTPGVSTEHTTLLVQRV